MLLKVVMRVVIVVLVVGLGVITFHFVELFLCSHVASQLITLGCNTRILVNNISSSTSTRIYS